MDEEFSCVNSEAKPKIRDGFSGDATAWG